MNDLLSLQVTQASLNQTAMAWSQNMANHYAAIDIAVAEGSDMVLMPELSTTGYDAQDNFQSTDNNRIYDGLCSMAAYGYARDPNLLMSVGVPWRLNMRAAFREALESGRLKPNPDIIKNALFNRLDLPFNVQVLIGGGRIHGMTAKSNLFNDERGYEKRYFSEWSFRDAQEYARMIGIDAPYGTIPIQLPDGKEVPFGQPLFFVTDENGQHYVHGQAICETKWAGTKFDGFTEDDSWYPYLNLIPSMARYLGTKEGLLIEIADASPPARLKLDKHMHLNDMASDHASVVVNTDGLGTSGSTFAQDGHRLISQDGQTISAGPRMEFGQLAVTTSVIQIPRANPDLAEKTHTTLKRQFIDPSAKPKAELAWLSDPDAAWDNPANPDRWKEERIRNQALWTYDYIRKVGSTVAVNASSGGQDSGYNITMDYVAIVMAMHTHGVEGLCDDMNVPYKDDVMKAFEEGGQEAAIKEFMNHYLVMYYFPTDNNSDDHERGARTLSEGGIDPNGQRFEGLGGRFVVRSIQDLVTMSAFVFGAENTGNIPLERRQEIMMELSNFVHASPSKYSPAEMQAWAERLQKNYPELEEVTSVALPGQSIAYENFQARLRTVLIWAAANVHKGMPRANPNLTEGYTNNTTAAGDLQGGAMNPNGGIFKDDEQELLRYLEEKGILGIIPPIKALSVINGNEPSAGLLPREEGEVVQNDADTMQATMPQITAMARLMHHNKIMTKDGTRDRNASEVYDVARTDNAFSNVDDNQLFNTVANFYRRWYSGQFKIHMTTIQPTFGENVDHQTSRRTPNLNGAARDEIIQMGLNVMFKWADEDGVPWTAGQRQVLMQRAWNGDTQFVREFMNGIRDRNADTTNMHYDLRALYERVKAQGWDKTFTPLPAGHAIQPSAAI